MDSKIDDGHEAATDEPSPVHTTEELTAATCAAEFAKSSDAQAKSSDGVPAPSRGPGLGDQGGSGRLASIVPTLGRFASRAHQASAPYLSYAALASQEAARCVCVCVYICTMPLCTCSLHRGCCGCPCGTFYAHVCHQRETEKLTDGEASNGLLCGFVAVMYPRGISCKRLICPACRCLPEKATTAFYVRSVSQVHILVPSAAPPNVRVSCPTPVGTYVARTSLVLLI